MRLLVKNVIVSITLALSDFISFILSLYIALDVLSLIVEKNDYLLLTNEIDGWFLLHWILGVCCVGWYSVRLRHYFYRKPFWFELKEILRTLVIFAIIEIAVMAFTTWSFSRYLWVITWLFVIILVPLSRMVTKTLLNKAGVWQRDTWIVGSSENAHEAYKAISGEKKLRFKHCRFHIKSWRSSIRRGN